ncbi:hypothetical protein KY284_020301 [Solanum tuberosum]|nr:hypothetical protein KY284_020301 [Solanum tuberosum]
MSTRISFLMLIGFRGFQPYAPRRVMHQLARVKEVPPNDDMSRFVFDTSPGFTFDSNDILKIWFGSIIFEQSEMVVEQDKGKVVLGYLSWFHDPVTFGDTLEGSSRKRKTSTPYDSWKKSWRRPKPPYPDKKFKSKLGRNHQLELQDVEGELKHT